MDLKPIEELVPLIQHCIEDMRRLQTELRPSMLDEMALTIGFASLFLAKENAGERGLLLNAQTASPCAQRAVYKVLRNLFVDG